MNPSLRFGFSVQKKQGRRCIESSYLAFQACCQGIIWTCFTHLLRRDLLQAGEGLREKVVARKAAALRSYCCALTWSFLSNKQALFLKFYLFPLRTHFISLSLLFIFSFSMSLTRFLFPFLETALLTSKSPLCIPDAPWFPFQPNLLGVAWNKLMCSLGIGNTWKMNCRLLRWWWLVA